MFQVVAFDCQLACNDTHKPQNGTITVVLTIEDINDNFPKFTEKFYQATVIQVSVVLLPPFVAKLYTQHDQQLLLEIWINYLLWLL